MTAENKPNENDEFTPESVKRIKEYQKTLREHNQNKTQKLTVTRRTNINTQVQNDEALKHQRSLALEVFPIVTVFFAVFLIILGIFFPENFIYGVLFSPLLLVFVVKIKQNQKTTKDLATAVAETTISVPSKLFSAKDPETVTTSRYSSIYYIGKLAGALAFLNLTLWFAGAFLYGNFLWQLIFGYDFQNLIVLLMAVSSIFVILRLRPKKPSKRSFFILLYVVKLLAIVVCVDMLVWVSGWLLYAYAFSSILLVPIGLYQIYLYIGVVTSTLLLFAARYITSRNLSSEAFTILLLGVSSVTCVTLYLMNLAIFLPSLGALMFFYYAFLARVILRSRGTLRER